jgi:hypothetical protein
MVPGNVQIKKSSTQTRGCPPVQEWIENTFTLKISTNQNVTQGLGTGWALRSLLITENKYDIRHNYKYYAPYS